MTNSNRQILLVEDTNALRIIAKKILTKAGYEVFDAANGEEGLKLLSMYSNIRLILLDIMMPKMDGIEFLERSKDIREQQGIKTCMLTAMAQSDDVKKCLVKGADDYIIKPMDNDLLLEKVGILLDGTSSDEFASIEAKLEAKILRINSTIDIIVTNLSECELTFLSKTDIPINAKIQIDHIKLKKILDITSPLILRVYKSEKSGKEFLHHATFIGLKDDNYKKIRAITTKGEALNE